jgi:transcriptional regulator with XRE-family HTH domain
MTSENALGGFLRARRELIKPEAVGIATGGRRRVPSLRREGLAMLAGISTDYYLRLEQGRDRNPSAQIIDSLFDARRRSSGVSACSGGVPAAAADA